MDLEGADEGGWTAGLDVADEGGDLNALTLRKGIVLRKCEEWGERDTGVTARRAVKACDGRGPIHVQYDSIGVGAGIKSETNRLIDERLMPKQMRWVSWNAGAAVLNPDKPVIERDKQSPLNKDFYKNLKAQGAWSLRRRFELTYRARTEPDFTFDVDDLISIDSRIPLLRKLEKELSQPTVIYSSRMQLMVDKKPEGARSPNLFDSLVMNYFPVHKVAMKITSDVLFKSRMFKRR